MDHLTPAQATSSSRAAHLLPTVAGLLVAGAVAFSATSPPTHYISWTSLLTFALQQLFEVAFACAMTVAALCAILSRWTNLDSHPLLVQTSRAAIWLAPLALLFRAKSSWIMVAVAAFAVLLTPLLRALGSPGLSPQDAVLFSLQPDNIPLFPKVRPSISIAAALCAQAGILAFFAGHLIGGSFLLGASFCAWTWWSIPSPDWPHAQSHSLPIALLSILFTVCALLPYLHGAAGLGLGSSHKYAVRMLADGKGPYPRYAAHILDDSSKTASEGNTGIILWPEKQFHTKLVAPAPIDLKTQFAAGRSANPLIIPFDGVYWFFKAPDVRPPKGSRQAQASPDAVDIRSTDRRPLSIEAHDYLGNLINLECCSRIQISIRNADRFPDTVSLELILVDTSKPRQPSQSLGTMMVKSTHPWRIYERPLPVSETLNFPIPPRASLRNFDEVKIVFRLDRARADSGARIAIDHFVLVPRGL